MEERWKIERMEEENMLNQCIHFLDGGGRGKGKGR